MDLCDTPHTGEDPSPERSAEEKQQIHDQIPPNSDTTLPQRVVLDVVEMIHSRYPQYPLKSILTAAINHLQPTRSPHSETVNQPTEKVDQPIIRVTQSDEKKEMPILTASLAVPVAPVRRRGRPPKVVKEANGERRIAQIYIQNGYGISAVKEKAGFEVDLNFYYTCLRNIMYGAFKKLENIAQTICRVNVQPSEEHKSQKFKNELCKCDKWMNTDELSTFHEYIKSVYDLEPRAVSKGQTVRLFNSLITHWSKVPH